jgi:hypothetical protein
MDKRIDKSIHGEYSFLLTEISVDGANPWMVWMSVNEGKQRGCVLQGLRVQGEG